MKSQNRKHFLDILRVIATGAVIMLHTVTGIKDTTDMNLYPMEFRVFLAIMDLVTWSVPVFIMISGYLFLNPAREFTLRQMVLKYCRRIVIALFLFGVPYACIELVMTDGKKLVPYVVFVFDFFSVFVYAGNSLDINTSPQGRGIFHNGNPGNGK